MRKKWKLYEKNEKQGLKKSDRGVLLLSHERFKILEFSILPSIDEKDREKSVIQRLEERFVDIRKLSFLYFELLSEEAEEERIFCSYLEEEIEGTEIFHYIDFAIPTYLLGKCFSEKENYLLVDYGHKSIFLCFYVGGKIYFFQKIEYLESIKNLDLLLEKNFFQEKKEGLKVFLLGQYTQENIFYWEEKYPVLHIENIKVKKIAKEIDIFQHERLKKGKYYKRILSMGASFLLIVVISFGFYFQYQIEEKKLILAQLEEENKLLEVGSKKLEENIMELQEEGEEEKVIEKKKVIPDLQKLYTLASTFDVLSLEYLETGTFKLQLSSFSAREYIKFTKEMLFAKFQWMNHDSIVKNQEEYKIELEVKKDEL